MTYKESIPIIERMIEKYHFTTEEKEAIRNVWYTIKRKADEEAHTPTKIYWAGDYFFHSFDAAMDFANARKVKHILEKTQDKYGNMKTKKYTISKGQVLSVVDV